jgi:hypothetical protein
MQQIQSATCHPNLIGTVNQIGMRIQACQNSSKYLQPGLHLCISCCLRQVQRWRMQLPTHLSCDTHHLRVVHATCAGSL